MGGKGRKRREKNYRAAHGGGYTRLPPPPDPSQVDALPSKLRKLISFTSSLSQGSASDSIPEGVQKKKKNEDGASELKSHPKDENNVGIKNANSLASQRTDDGDDIVKSSMSEKKKRKRKRKEVEDLRFVEALEKPGISSKRREHKKKYLEAKKNKHKKGKTEDNLDFPGQEKIKFGDIVQAPPKLAAIPKAFKNSTHDASKERVRLKAIEEYRKRRGWTSRPGIHLPSSITAMPEL